MKPRPFLLILISVFFVILQPQRAFACSCNAKPTVLDEFETSEDVIIAEIKSIVKDESPQAVYHQDGIAGAKMSVIKVYKGSLKAGNEVFFEQGSGADCIQTYSDKMVGLRLLIYDSLYKGRRFVSFCGRSSSLQLAADDLKYLDSLDKVKGKTRISGTYRFGFIAGVPAGQSVAGKYVRIIGKNRTFRAITDQNGVYELYGLPPGRYFVEPQLPLGWEISRYMLDRSSNMADYSFYDRKTNRFRIEIKAGGHSFVDVYLDIDNVIKGRIVAPNGKPMRGICIYAVSADSPEDKYGSPGCVDEKGSFSITGLYGDAYVLVINGDGKVTGKQPVEKLFYPGVTERAKARVIKMEEGKRVVLPVFRIPRLVKTVRIIGFLKYADGTPAKTERVQFVSDTEESNRENKPYVYTDQDGRFELVILSGQSGKIRGEMVVGEGTLQRCPHLRNIVLEPTVGAFETGTKWLDVDGTRDQTDLTLTFPFERCDR